MWICATTGSTAFPAKLTAEYWIAKSLVGDYRPEHLFTLGQSLEAYRSDRKMLDECDREIRRNLENFKPPEPPSATVEKNSHPAAKKLTADGVLRTELRRVFGIDLTKIPGIRTGIAQTLFGEIGPDFTKFRSASAFASWMGLCPDNDMVARDSDLVLPHSIDGQTAGIGAVAVDEAAPCTAHRIRFARRHHAGHQ